MDSIVKILQELKTIMLQAVLIVADIVMILSFGAAVILGLVMIIANQRGTNVGFSAGEWIIRCGIASATIFIAKAVFNIS